MAQEKDKALKYHVPALSKGLDILEYLSELNVPQSQADIARALNRKTSEVFRMLDCLEQRHYLQRDNATGKYQLSLKLFKLAHSHSPLEKLLESARKPMRDVAQNLRESVHLSIFHEGQLLVVAESLSPNPIRISVEVGKSFPALKTASGKLILAHLHDEVLEAFCNSDAHFINLSLVDQKTILKSLDAQRDYRYLVSNSDITVGVQDVAQLIGEPNLGIMATLTVPLLMLKNKELETEKTLLALQEAAREINKGLGFGS